MRSRVRGRRGSSVAWQAGVRVGLSFISVTIILAKGLSRVGGVHWVSGRLVLASCLRLRRPGVVHDGDGEDDEEDADAHEAPKTAEVSGDIGDGV